MESDLQERCHGPRPHLVSANTAPGHFNTHQFSGKRLTFRDKLEHLSLDCLLRLYFVMTIFLQLSDGESCIDSGRGGLDIDNNEKGFIVF